MRLKAKNFFFGLLITIIVVGVGFVPTYNLIMKIIYPLSHSDDIYQYASEYGLDPYLIMGVIRAESNFISDARSNKSANGLMQITDTTASWIAEKLQIQDFDTMHLSEQPALNIQMGCWYMRYLFDKYNNNINLALCAYNAGEGNVDKWLADYRYSKDGRSLEKIPFPETKTYTERVLRYEQEYKKLYRGKGRTI